MPAVSVILPTYNRRRWLAEAVRSVLTQSVRDLELVIVDDGSDDGSVDELPPDPRLVIVSDRHCGNVGTLRQRGLLKASSPFVAFLDSDDRWTPRSLEVRQAAIGTAGASWCYGAHRLIDETGTPVPARAGDLRASASPEALVERVLSTAIGIPVQTMLVRKELALAVGFDASLGFGDDFGFAVGLVTAAPPAVTDEVVAEIREHADRGSQRRYNQVLGYVRTYRRYSRTTSSPRLRRICRQRTVELSRHYLARSRADNRLFASLEQLARAWFG